MAIHIKINVADPGQLDGQTEIPDTIQGVKDGQGVLVFDLPVGQAFGLFDPGKYLAGQSSNLRLKSVSFMAAPGNEVDGDLSIAPPGEDLGVYPANTVRRKIVDFAALGAGNPLKTGLLTEGLCTPLPTTYRLAFRTNSAVGPYTIQLALEPVRRNPIFCLEPLLG